MEADLSPPPPLPPPPPAPHFPNTGTATVYNPPLPRLPPPPRATLVYSDDPEHIRKALEVMNYRLVYPDQENPWSCNVYWHRRFPPDDPYCRLHATMTSVPGAAPDSDPELFQDLYKDLRAADLREIYGTVDLMPSHIKQELSAMEFIALKGLEARAKDDSIGPPSDESGGSPTEHADDFKSVGFADQLSIASSIYTDAMRRSFFEDVSTFVGERSTDTIVALLRMAYMGSLIRDAQSSGISSNAPPSNIN